ncbi:hypothetical protein EV643_10848 [Kribbella sp. VKM Ac-2527]|uniref:Uncharacterized protein n=1 Tax=Kribbella caucasensis TaxID=2512215 RepID=A0A4R6KBV3_9ACTN|nr:hypothetical protein [Kribbella sp. VKM Ac-2527]TDO47742.1 hypothetical protein EV643_10848 [Kribbella sp. VKM Ac-2527]
MIVLALILVAVAVALGVGVAASSAADANLEVFGAGLGVTVAGIFFAGAATAAALVLGLWLLKKGMRRGYRRRREVQELRTSSTPRRLPPPNVPAKTSLPTTPLPIRLIPHRTVAAVARQPIGATPAL